jgi:guanosine-3',5'-bis(diphosphate) 3'-pyrophosphohydrolase
MTIYLEETREEKAATLARIAHKDQRYSDKPYFAHLERVVNNLRKQGEADEDAIIIAWLHDIVEDTDVELEGIRKEFGDRVYHGVDAISRRKSQDGSKESEIAYLTRVLNNQLARRVKFADAMDNLLMCRAVNCPPEKRHLHRKYMACIRVLIDGNVDSLLLILYP